MKELWRVTLVMDHKRTRECWAGVWLVACDSADQAIQETIDALHLDGVDVIDKTAELYPADTPILVGSCIRVREYETKTNYWKEIDT